MTCSRTTSLRLVLCLSVCLSIGTFFFHSWNILTRVKKTCQTKNSITDVFSFTVPPNATIFPKNLLTLQALEPLTLTCAVQGDPQPSVDWTWNGVPDMPNARFSQNKTTLTIAHVGLSDEGLYECMASNRAGNSSAVALLNVQGKPAMNSSSRRGIFLEARKIIFPLHLGEPFNSTFTRLVVFFPFATLSSVVLKWKLL